LEQYLIIFDLTWSKIFNREIIEVLLTNVVIDMRVEVDEMNVLTITNFTEFLPICQNFSIAIPQSHTQSFASVSPHKSPQKTFKIRIRGLDKRPPISLSKLSLPKPSN
jgi:hypothetical protein